MSDHPYPHPFKHKQSDYQNAGIEFLEGTITSASIPTLTNYLSALGSNATGDDSIQSHDQIQAMAISHILTQKYISDVEKRSKFTTTIVVLLALASFLASAVQIYLAVAS